MTDPILLNISEMIDLAIGTPEVGVVDFNMLQTVLHCLAQQLRVLGKNVELRGSVTTLPPGRDQGNVQTVAITELVVDTDDVVDPDKKLLSSLKLDKETILIVERVKKPALPPAIQTRDRSPTLPRDVPSTEKLSLVTLSKFNLLENVVDDLKNRVYGSIPKNEDIIEEVRSQTNLKAITDMWTSLNVSSRLEAAEGGISKLSSLVQDLINELQDKLNQQSSTLSSSASVTEPSASKEELHALKKRVKDLKTDLADLRSIFKKTLEQMQAGFGTMGAGTTALPSDSQAVSDTAETTEGAPPSGRRATQPLSTMTAEMMTRVNELEKKLNKCCDAIGKKEDVVLDQVNSLQEQLDGLMKQVAAMTQDLAEGKLSPDLMKDLQGLMQLFTTVQEMQEQLAQVHETALQLATEKDDRQHNMNVIIEQIEFLKTIKMDREDMVEAMAEKADLRMLARKVSHDQFEMACDDLSKGLEQALGKLNLQEALWQQALDDIQREIEMKLDKMELSPLKEFFNNKLKQLQENLKRIALLRQEAEAAGTKKKLLRDVNCISCDAKAVMAATAESTVPVSRPLPAHHSMKPYLSYELDAIRKTQATNLPQRNMHDWENIDKQMGQAKPAPQRVRSATDKHLCNRYCGGSHTVTTPAQRVARLGHFIKQWGPDVLPLSSGLAAGDDGRLYKVSNVETANVGPGGAIDNTCTPKPAPSKHEKQTLLPSKPIAISAECRCLDGGDPRKG